MPAVPTSLYDVLSYYNVPVNATEEHRDNPLRVLASLCAPGDFVVLKIDIDAKWLRQPFAAADARSPLVPVPAPSPPHCCG